MNNELTYEEIQARKAEIVERRSAIETELETADAEALQALEAEVDGLNEETRSLEEREAAILKAAEERKAQIDEVLTRGKETKSFEEKKIMNEEIRNSKEYIDAFAEYIKTGDDKECRALLSENVSGTAAFPELVVDRVRTAWNREGITSLVRKTYLKGNLKIGFERSADGAYVHTEASNSACTEESLTLGIVSLVPESIKKWISISDEVYDLRGEAFLNYIYDELTYQIAKKTANLIVADIVACGTASAATCPAVPKITATTVTVGLVAQAMAQLSDEAANPVVIMNKATWGDFKAAQAQANYGYDPFEGLKVVFNDSLATFSAATTGVCYAIVGDLGQGAQLNFPAGEDIEIKFDDKTLMEKDLIRILGRSYVGHGVVANNAFCKIVH